MGLDARVGWIAPPPHERLIMLRALFDEDFADIRANDCYPYLSSWGQVISLDRYFDRYYPRGHWPTLARYIDWMWSHHHGAVYYRANVDDHYSPLFHPAFTRYEYDHLWSVWKELNPND